MIRLNPLDVCFITCILISSELYAAVRKGQDGGSFRGHVFRETQREAVKARVSNYRRICFEYILKGRGQILRLKFCKYIKTKVEKKGDLT